MAVDREIAGRCKCPICGALSQDVRVNVNQKLYGYCDNGCSFKFNSAQSRQFLPLLRAGKNVTTQTGLVIFSNKEISENAENKEHGTDFKRTITTGTSAENKEQGTDFKRTITTGTNAAVAVGRIETGRRERDAATVATGKPRGLFASWLDDDDDE